MRLKYFFLTVIVVGLFFLACSASAHQPRIIYNQAGDIQIFNPELSQAFYDELNEGPRYYFINSDKNFNLYINILVPAESNETGRYAFSVYKGLDEGPIFSSAVLSNGWELFYEPFGRDYYYKGSEFLQQMTAGNYKIEVSSSDNQGKYVLAVGEKEEYNLQALLAIYWQIPFLKLTFFKTSVLQFFLTPFGIYGVGAIGGLLIFLASIYYLVGLAKQIIKHNEAKTLLLTSGGMPQMKDEIIKLLQKPTYDITVAFITTAAKPQENLDYVAIDWQTMKEELRFNIEEVDIEGKTEHQVLRLLELKDIIFVEGGNTFYLLKAMRACNFEKVIRKLLKQGKVYIGVSAGSIVAGKTIKTAEWLDKEYENKNTVKLKNLKGLNLVPFDIFVHYQPEHAEIIEQQMPNPKKRAKKLRILTDEQAILVQGKEENLIGDGEAIII